MNKKILKSIVCIASGIAIAASMPFTTTSCGSSSTALPYEVYKYNEKDPTILTGFTDVFLANEDDYNMYNTMEIPANVKTIDGNAFYNGSESTIPLSIKFLTFAKGSNCSVIQTSAFKDSSLVSVNYSNASKLSFIFDNVFENCTALGLVDLSNCHSLLLIGGNAFKNCASLSSISLPSSLNGIAYYAFNNCSNLSAITWDAWENKATLDNHSFNGVADGGTIKVTNPVHGFNSEALLEHLIKNADLPSNWHI